MPGVCLYLKAHQPLRVKRYKVFDIGSDHNYFNERKLNDTNNVHILKKVVRKSYLPTNTLLLKLLKQHPDFRVSFSLTGTLLDQLEEHAPEVIELFQKLVETGRVEILGETYHHSLSFFYSLSEFEREVEMHRKKIKHLFGLEPKVFSNTELAYSNDLAQWADKAGYKGIIAEGWEKVLEWRSPNFVYKPIGTKNIRVLLKNYKLADDIAFRFSEPSWEEYPLTVERYANWITDHNGSGEVINLFMDYETFGEHQWEETGIFDFLEMLPAELLKHEDNVFLTPSEVIDRYEPVGEIDVKDVLTWADTDRDLTAWTGNKMQQDAIAAVYEMEKTVLQSKNEKLIRDWQHLLTSDHFYYMCTKWFADGDVHAYFSPYESPYEAFIAYMNVLQDMQLRLNPRGLKSPRKAPKR